MSTITPKAVESASRHQVDWAAQDALTDDQIAVQISVNPDAAPDVSDWPIEHARLVEAIDVKAIRAKTGMSQDRFAQAFGLNLNALRDWEHRRRAPRGPARTLLQIIDREPVAVRRALKPRRPARTIMSGEC